MKKILGISLFCGLLMAYAQAPIFQSGEYLTAGGNTIDVGYFGAPLAYDWDGDAKKDLIVGQFDYGKIRFYKNSGEHDDPAFDIAVFLQAGGVDITLPYG